jgi:GTP-binding protein Era
MKHEEAVAEGTSGSTSITKKILQRLTKQAQQGVADSDISLLVIDAARTMTDSVRETLASLMFYACLTHVQQQRQQLQQQPNNTKLIPLTTTVPLIIVLNKVDLVKPKTNLLQLAYEMCLMANTCWDRAEKFNMDELEDLYDDDGKDNQAQVGKILLALDGENINDLLPKDHMGLTQSTSEASNVTTPSREEENHHPQQREFCPVFMVSALQDDGVQDMVQYLVNEAMPGDWVDTEGNGNTTTVTDMSPQEHATEIIREKIYRTVHQEVPYHVYQKTCRFEYVSAASTAGHVMPPPPPPPNHRHHPYHPTEEVSLSNATDSTRTSINNNNNNNNNNQNKILCIEHPPKVIRDY